MLHIAKKNVIKLKEILDEMKYWLHMKWNKTEVQGSGEYAHIKCLSRETK
jgi:hypothetical protein